MPVGEELELMDLDFRSWPQAEIVAFNEDHTVLCSASKRRRITMREVLRHIEQIPGDVRAAANLPDISTKPAACQKQASLLSLIDNVISNGLVYWALRETE